MKPEDVTQELFDAELIKLVDEDKASNLLLMVPGVYEAVAEEYNNEVLKRLEEIEIIDIPMNPGTTKADRVRQLGLNEFTFDYAIPHDWLERAVENLKTRHPGQYGEGEGKLNPYQAILGGTVWLYDKHGRIFGRPYPITRTAKDALERLSDVYGYIDEEPEKQE